MKEVLEEVGSTDKNKNAVHKTHGPVKLLSDHTSVQHHCTGRCMGFNTNNPLQVLLNNACDA